MTLTFEKKLCPACWKYKTHFHKHHTSYFPENTILVCCGCHKKIHNAKKYFGLCSGLCPPEYHKTIFYSQNNWIRDSKKFAIRRLTFEELVLKYSYRKLTKSPASWVSDFEQEELFQKVKKAVGQ